MGLSGDGRLVLWGSTNFLRLNDVFGCRVVDVEAICCLFDCHLVLVHEFGQLLAFFLVYSLIAPLI